MNEKINSTYIVSPVHQYIFFVIIAIKICNVYCRPIYTAGLILLWLSYQLIHFLQYCCVMY
jgi:hypothetical protein